MVKQGTPSWNAALITVSSQKNGKPTIGDALEILKYMAKMKSRIT
jgi:hypothetical protein